MSTNERTPDGIDQHELGAKLDAGKNRLGLVLGGFSNALKAVGEVGTFGANKYTDNGWMHVNEGIPRYTDAAFRHQLEELSGETIDPETGFLHAAHTAWNSLARLELMIRSKSAGKTEVKNDSVDAGGDAANFEPLGEHIEDATPEYILSIYQRNFDEVQHDIHKLIERSKSLSGEDLVQITKEISAAKRLLEVRESNLKGAKRLYDKS